MNWDTKPGRKWVVVANWGVDMGFAQQPETTVTFHRDEQEANEEYEKAVEAGADAFYATTVRMKMQGD